MATRARLAAGAAALVLLSLASLVGVSGGIDKFLYYIKNIGLKQFTLSFLLLLAADTVRAARLMLLARQNGIQIGFKASLMARLVGRLFGILTPGYTGATPARAAVISAYERVEPGRSMGLSTMESVYDSLLPVFVTLALTIPLLPKSIIPFTVSLLVALLWVGGIYWARTSSFVRFLERIVPRVDIRCYILRQRRQFLVVLRESTYASRVLPALTMTILSHIIETISILVLVGGPLTSYGLRSIFLSFLTLEVSHVMVMSPTPGGAVFFEYGLAGFLPPEAVVHWRIVFVLYSLLPGAILIALLRRVREYVESLEAEIHDSGCEDL